MNDAQKEFISTIRAAMKSDNAREVQAAIAEPTVTVTTAPRTVTKDPATLEWEQGCLADMERMQELLTGSKANAVQALTKSTSVQRAQAMRGVKGANPAKVAELSALSDALMDHRAEARDRNMWPIPDHFGQASYTELTETRTLGPSKWQAAFPGEPVPTVEAVAKEMT